MVQLLYHKNTTRDEFLDEMSRKREIPDSEMQLLIDFIAYRVRIGKVKSQSSNRIKHLYQLRRDFFKKDFIDMTEKDINKVIDGINAHKNSKDKHYKESTKKDFNVVLKSFYKWLRTEHGYPANYEIKELAGTKLKKNSRDYPEEVAELPTTLKSNDYVKPSELLTEDEVKKLIDAAEHPRDKAFIAMLYESGARIGEIGTLKLKDVYMDQSDRDIMIAEVQGKTGPRNIPLRWCIPWVLTWKDMHPLKDDGNTSFWINYGARAHNEPMSYAAFRIMLDRTFERAKINKKSNPHLFRKSIATAEARGGKINSYLMNQKFGWTQSSKVANVYIRLGQDDLKEYVKAKGGLTKEQEHKSKLESINCVRCGTINSDLEKPCFKCGAPLTPSQGLKVQLEKQAMETKINQMEGILTALVESNPKVKKALAEYVNRVKNKR